MSKPTQLQYTDEHLQYWAQKLLDDEITVEECLSHFDPKTFLVAILEVMISTQ